MDLEIKGTIKKINPIESGTSKAGKQWQKRSFIIDSGDKYNPDVCFSVFGDDKVANLTKFNNVGDVVIVKFNVSSREFNGKYYHNLDAWRIDKDGITNTPEQTPSNDVMVDGGDDLPF
jgi:hypothetical protein